MKLSLRAKHIGSSPIRSPVAPTDSRVYVHRLNIGQPDIHSPQEFLDGVRSFSHPVVAYDAAYRDWETDRKSTRLNSSHRL